MKIAIITGASSGLGHELLKNAPKYFTDIEEYWIISRSHKSLEEAAKVQLQAMKLIRLLFSEVNPIPVKAAMKIVGYDCGSCRLPLTPASQTTVKNLKNLLLPH